VTGSDPLAGVWRVREVRGLPVPADGEVPSLDLDGAGRMVGYAGVNRVAASYALTGGALTVGPVISTRTAGPPEWTAVESRMLASLARPVAVAIDGDRLTLGVVEPMLLDRAPAAPEEPLP